MLSRSLCCSTWADCSRRRAVILSRRATWRLRVPCIAWRLTVIFQTEFKGKARQKFMPTLAPLQLLLFRHMEDDDVLPYQEAILRAFQGGKEASNYLATGEDLGIQL